MTLTQLVLSTLIMMGDFTIFVGRTFKVLGRLWKRRELFLRHCEYIGVSSTGIIVVAATFLGAVLGYQLYVSFHLFGAEALLGGSVGISLFRELAPVMTAIMVTGRAGAAMAAELSSMKISEQIDALEIMAINPIEYLVTPRVIAGLVMLPILAIIFSTVASLAAALVACGIMDLSYATYWDQFTKMVDVMEIYHCVSKAATFGLVLTSIGCFNGFKAQGGARAVGFATRSTVVASFLMILLADYLLTSILPFGFSWLKL